MAAWHTYPSWPTASTSWPQPLPTSSCGAVIIRGQDPDPALRRAMGKNAKGTASLALYLAGVLSALLGGAHQAVWSFLGVALFDGAAILWLVPDRRIERSIGAEPGID